MANLTLIEAMTKTADLVYEKVKTLLGNKVDKVQGKGLSTNDYTATDKTKLTGIEAGANKTVVDTTLTSTGANPVRGSVIYQRIATLESSISGNFVSNLAKGVPNGVAELDSSGKVPSTQLPGFVDDVVDSYIVSGSTALTAGWLSTTSSGKAFTPETGKIYNVVSSGEYQNQSYRWSGTAYARLNEGVALGETQYTAYRGDRGKIAYEEALKFQKVYNGTDSEHRLLSSVLYYKLQSGVPMLTGAGKIQSQFIPDEVAMKDDLLIDETALASAVNAVLTN